VGYTGPRPLGEKGRYLTKGRETDSFGIKRNDASPPLSETNAPRRKGKGPNSRKMLRKNGGSREGLGENRFGGKMTPKSTGPKKKGVDEKETGLKKLEK